MEKNILSVREIEEKDITLIADYWFNSGPGHLEGMGVDMFKMPSREQFMTTLLSQLPLPYEDKKAYGLVWEVDGESIGHCNVNPIIFAKEASMHLHIWKGNARNKGYGADLIKMSLPYFFKNLQLEHIYSEPFALNPAPNRTLQKAGFTFVKEYITSPGAITFEQPVIQWEIKCKI